MKAQDPELFIYRSSVYKLHNDPLRSLLEQRGLEDLDFGRWLLSSCRRGYQGLWDITSFRLYLIALADPGGDEVEFSAVFPECESRIFAHWFTGTIRLPYGEQLGGHGEEMVELEHFEFYHELEFKNGVLVRA